MRKKPLYERIRFILESARTGVARTVNTTQVVSNWLIGREIVEEEQHGDKRAEYGQKSMIQTSERLRKDFGVGYSVQNLFYMRQLYQTYPLLLPVATILHAVRGKSIPTDKIHAVSGKSGALSRKFTLPAVLSFTEIGHALRGQSWKPGLLHPNLSWTHYRTLLKVEKAA